MSSVECLREFVWERLTAAAEEIFRVFKKTIVEYEEEIDRQRRLLDAVLKHDINLQSELPQQNVCAEEEVEEKAVADQQFCTQERNSSLDQDDPEPPQIKKEREELCTTQEEETLVLKMETDTFMLTPTYEESDHQLLSEGSHIAENQDQKDCNGGEEVLTRNAEQALKECHYRSESHNINVYSTYESEIDYSTQTVKKSFKCDICGMNFNCQSKFSIHMRTHTGEKPYSCGTCGRKFSRTSDLNIHIRTHTGEKPYTCKTCGKGFKQSSALWVHVRTHTGEKPYVCKTCGKDFSRNDTLTIHVRRAHTGEKPYGCNFCGKRFVIKSDLSGHIRSHMGKKSSALNTCGILQS